MDFPVHVYRSPGSWNKRGYTYDVAGANNQEEFDAKLASGWFATFEDAIEAAGEAGKVQPIVRPGKKKVVKKRKPSKPLLTYAERKALLEATKIEVDPENAAPRRAEMEEKANELGIKFDGRTSDKKLLERIEDALKD